jgi:HD superfamily phosphohydrolase YqeK
MGTKPTERTRWLRAAWLHDALRDAPLPTSFAHGPAAADRASQEGETDRGVLDAVRYHTIGYSDWDDVGRMLYMADFLEPGRTFASEERRALAARVPREPDVVLRDVARRRVEWVVRSGWPLLPETVSFWNALISR